MTALVVSVIPTACTPGSTWLLRFLPAPAHLSVLHSSARAETGDARIGPGLASQHPGEGGGAPSKAWHLHCAP